VPIATFTPAAIARLTDASCTACTTRAFSTTASGSEAPAAARVSTARGAASVGTSQVPCDSIRSMASSSR
jgi:hypothetical protein